MLIKFQWVCELQFREYTELIYCIFQAVSLFFIYIYFILKVKKVNVNDLDDVRNGRMGFSHLVGDDPFYKKIERGQLYISM